MNAEFQAMQPQQSPGVLGALPAGMPLLVVVNSADPNRFSSYVLEILSAEGLFARDVHDISVRELSLLDLAAYGVVLIADIELSLRQQNAIRKYVKRGGRIVALRPPMEMTDVFGVEPNPSIVNRQARDRYLALNIENELIGEMPSHYLQFMGTADLLRPAGADVLAYIAGDLERPTAFAAITLADYGDGHAAMFAYDLASSIVMQHQGREQNASTGTNADADGDGRWSPNDLFMDQLDPRLKHIPQADVHQELLATLLTWFGRESAPLPRAWYFPKAAPCIAWFNGDSDGMNRNDYDTIVSTIERHGGHFTVYLMDEHHGLFAEEDVTRLRSRGHAFGQHTNLELQVTIEEAEATIARSLEGFRETFGSDSLTHRGHCLVWPGWTEMADILSDHGVRFDQCFVPRRYLKDGYLNGSGRPARFVRRDGTLVNLYEQNTLLTDDGCVEPDKFLIPTGTPEEVIQTGLALLDEAITHYHSVFQVAFHPHLTGSSAMWLLEALVVRCEENGIPMLSGDEWVDFHAAWRRVRFYDYHADVTQGEVRFRVSSEADIKGLTIMLPMGFATNRLETLRIRQSNTPWTLSRRNGFDHGCIDVDLMKGEEILVEAVYSDGSEEVRPTGVKKQRSHRAHSSRGQGITAFN